MDHQSHEPARFWYYYDFSPLQPGRYYCGDCFQLLPAIESGTVDMVLIDPPYYMGKDKAWDCFEGRADYMAFMGRAFIQAQRILKENGTLGFWHNDLQKITWLCDWLERNTDMRFATWGIWVKPNHRRKIWVNPGPGNTLRSWFNIGEFCVFFVKGTAGTAWNKTGLELAKLNTENFGSLRDYFRRLLEYTGATKRQIIETVGQSADHCFRFGSTQWLLPTRETYLKIVAAFHCDSWEGYRTFESLEARKGPGLIKKGGAAKSSATGGAAQQPQPKTRQTTSLPTCLNTRTKSEGTRALCSRKSIFSRLRISGRLNSSIGVRRRARRNDKPREGSNQTGQHRHSAGR